MTKQGQKPIEIGLVLQGGGALGAYECGAVTALLDLMDRPAARRGQPSPCSRRVTGVSIGAVNAGCIVGAQGRADVEPPHQAAVGRPGAAVAPNFLAARGAARPLRWFGLPGFYTPRPGPVDVSLLDALSTTPNPLVATLTRHIDFDALNANPTSSCGEAPSTSRAGRAHALPQLSRRRQECKASQAARGDAKIV